MRSCLIQIVLVAFVIVLLLWFGLPIAVSALATRALASSGFSGTDTKVEVSANPPPLLITGHADSVHIASKQVGVSDLHASSVDVTLKGVDLLSRKIDSVEGTLTGVGVAAPNGDTVQISTVTLSGPADNAVATCALSIAATEALAESQLKSQGVNAQVQLKAPNLVTLNVGGKAFGGHLAAREGQLFLVSDSPAMPSVLLIAPGNGNPFRVTGVNIDSSSVNVTGTLDVQDLLS
jgi:hypothetical protein